MGKTKLKSGKVGLKESEIQRQIIDWLELKENQGKLFFQRTNNIPVSQMRNGKRIFRSMAKGQKKGFPDILVLKAGRVIGLEVKTKTGKQSPFQKEIEKSFKKNGGEYYIVRSLEQVMFELDNPACKYKARKNEKW